MSHEPFKVLDLFSGIGGFSLGLERTGGFKTVAFCEIEPHCKRVLRKHWPHVPCYEDVVQLRGEPGFLTNKGGFVGECRVAVDVLCGGFPCQDISQAGKRAGIEGKRSGLWSEYARLIGEIRPRYAIVENVAALLNRGMGRVLGDLAALGYDAEWHCIPASAVGAPHRRDRIWIVAYPHSPERRPFCEARDRLAKPSNGLPQRQEGAGGFAASGQDVADAERRRLPARDVKYDQGHSILFAARSGEGGGHYIREARWAEPRLDRVAYGVPNQMERCVALGNAVVPQIPELIGRAILQAEGRLAA